MEKEDILAKSRAENKDQDLYAIELQINAGNLSALIALALATVFFVTQSLVGGGFNYGLYALVVSFGAVRFVVLASRLKRPRDIALAVLYTAATLVLSVLHMAQLLAPAAL